MDLAVIISSLLSGLLGAMGFGGGSVLIIYLTSYLHIEQRQAQGINLVFFIPIAALSVIMYLKAKLINIKEILPVLLPALVGAAVGFILLAVVPTQIAARLFGAILVLMGISYLRR